MRAVLYVRVSTEGQERDGTSLESQEQDCRTLARSAGWQVVELIRDTA
jgi:DNA invertase Pin-like site-specific DNA recombinase